MSRKGFLIVRVECLDLKDCGRKLVGSLS